MVWWIRTASAAFVVLCLAAEAQAHLRASEDCTPLTNAPDPKLCMPWLNFGTGSPGQHPERNIPQLIQTWVESAGGVGIDTAWNYGTEKAVGSSVHKFRKGTRYFLTTKVPPDGLELSRARAESNMRDLNLDIVDVLLIHQAPANQTMLAGTWQALVEQLEKGNTRSIGVSNWGVEHLKALEALKSPYKPVVNQVRMFIGCMPPQELIDFSNDRGIVTESYSPIGHNGMVARNPVVMQVAAAYNRTPGQVAVQYLIQKGFTMAFSTQKLTHMVENQSVLSQDRFTLSEADMHKLDTVPRKCTPDVDNQVVV
eukprot:CAMPEP_0184541200 /NCGR_PEP_ID=MMETSP0199_2-20130426/1247_1 /TAXON_ID=1112570 /ORGANISM="Thraustochytrium sp., Strain LLF1b" /LENGTH=310 /DNA_ID=CAMNT_0026934911 /DNA_START=20 /DNA_END=952 /DNA_ORIENTATION=+